MVARALWAVEWIVYGRTLFMLVAGAWLGLFYLGLLPTPWPSKRPSHKRGRGRPTWTRSPLYHSLGLEALPASAESLARTRRRGAAIYVNLAVLSRFSRAVAAPTKTVRMVRTSIPPEDIP